MLAEALLGKGLDVRIFDAEVSLARLVGANKEYIEREIPHIASLLVGDLDEAVAHGEVLIVGNRSKVFQTLRARCCPGQIILDLAHTPGLDACLGVTYRGITW